jgi:hypothetical protein
VTELSGSEVPDPIRCGEILYRALLKPQWIDPDNEDRVTPEAFFRRRPIKKKGSDEVDPRDQDGLSLFFRSRISAEESVHSFGRCYGLATVHVGKLRDHGLRVIPDPEDDRKVLIPNLPYENPGTKDEEKLVGNVAKTARICLKCDYKRPKS